MLQSFCICAAFVGFLPRPRLRCVECEDENEKLRPKAALCPNTKKAPVGRLVLLRIDVPQEGGIAYVALCLFVVRRLQ